MGYLIAEDIEDLKFKVRRKRNPDTALVRNIGRHKCRRCGILMTEKYPVNPGEEPRAQDKDYYYVYYHPRAKKFVPMHYYCSWGALMEDIFALHKRMRG